MLKQLKVPGNLTRNHLSIMKKGVVRTGKMLIDMSTELAGLDSLEGKSVLDVGCGTRFTSAIINRNVPIRRYTGIDVYKPVIDYLKTNVEPHDERFQYAHWNVVNELYNKEGAPFTGNSSLPIDDSSKFDFIWMFSVITHQDPEGTVALFNVMKKYVANGGAMLFTAYSKSNVDKFEDVIKDQPLMMAYYNHDYMLELLDETGWKVKATRDPDEENSIHQFCFLCTLK